MNKAIIVEVSNRHLIVLAEGGEFKKIKNTNPKHQVGQEIILPTKNLNLGSFMTVMFNWKTGTAAALAIILLFFQVLSPITGQGAYAYVGMDMDPSLELKINGEMQVLNIVSFNEEGKNVLQRLDGWKKQNISKVTNDIFEISKKLGYLEPDEEVLITTTLSEEIPENKEQELKERVNEVMNKTAKEKSVEMTTIVISSKEREEAKKMKISPGQYAIYTAAKKSGINITAKEVSGKTIEEISEKVGPIKELLEQNKETASTKKENHVYDPPLPVLDQKEDKVSNTEEENSIKEISPAPAKAEKPAVAFTEPKIIENKNTSSLTKTEKNNDKEKVLSKEKEKPKAAPTAKSPTTENETEFPDKKADAVAHPSKSKEEKPKAELPIEEPQVEAPKAPVETPVNETEQQAEQEEPAHSTDNDKDNWIIIEIILDGTLLTVHINADSNVIKENLSINALAHVNQNLLTINETVPSPEIKQNAAYEISSTDTKMTELKEHIEKVTSTNETNLQQTDQKAS
ncbi:anti-sigma factor domain-containing protein [Bacillus sp. NEB1478]|uniref:anti-sigma-I factor RsgI family protein n=1 Tax=Bacillus sp. NEB1478 TaxID=3073816 RepID=UPI002873BA59|nr:anti-sigma factor domain-containing protein [Bacillus sp. NEB1478]WNB93008.1 anti-sigma factor domain-containing protein [Bacillus sp. NEB1478]